MHVIPSAPAEAEKPSRAKFQTRIKFSVTDAQNLWIKAEAERAGVSEAEVLRRMVDKKIEP